MRVNIYAEEMTDRLEIIQKSTEAGNFTGLRFYLELPISAPPAAATWSATVGRSFIALETTILAPLPSGASKTFERSCERRWNSWTHTTICLQEAKVQS